MEILRYILGIYALLGIFIAGGLLFNHKKEASYLLAAFALIYALEAIDFLYQTSPFVTLIPEFFMLGFPLCLLTGPALYLHLRQAIFHQNISQKDYWLHSLPFWGYFIFTLYLCFSFSGTTRITFVENNYQNLIMPLNYGKVIHVVIYGMLIGFLVVQQQKKLDWQLKQYVFTLSGIYLITAVVLTCLTALMVDYNYFIAYFLGACTLVLFSGYTLYCHPNLLQTLQAKYAHSGLSELDKKRIAQKIALFLAKTENITDRKLNLSKLSTAISEQKHHVSQTLSDKFNASFNHQLNAARINYAKHLLQDHSNNHLKILAIAFEVGFTSKSTFHRAFVKFAHCTPNEWRQKYQIK